MSKRKPKKPTEAMQKDYEALQELQPLQADPWPVICPACEGNSVRFVDSDSKMPFDALVSGHKYHEMYQCLGKLTIVCARCDGRGTVVV